MTISDQKFGAEIITKKGRVYKFDEPLCLINYLKSKDLTESEIKNIYSTDFSKINKLVNINASFFLESEIVKGPMGGTIAIFGSRDSLNVYLKKMNGIETNWNKIYLK